VQVKQAHRLFSIVLGGCVAASSAAAHAQTAAPSAEIQARQLRYQIGVMEQVLERAVDHGIRETRERLQAVVQMPSELMLSDNAHARGFRLDGYGVFFDVTVPSFFETTLWTMRTLDQNDLGLARALKDLQAFVKSSGNANVEQALKRLELQVHPATLASAPAQPTAEARNATGSAALEIERPARDATPDPILTDPNEAYRTEVIRALKEAMLDHSTSLNIGAMEWLTIAARGNDDRPRLAQADNDARTRIIRLSGSDLAAYLARQITKDEALNRIQLNVF
jgi:hypothetical protein